MGRLICVFAGCIILCHFVGFAGPGLNNIFGKNTSVTEKSFPLR